MRVLLILFLGFFPIAAFAKQSASLPAAGQAASPQIMVDVKAGNFTDAFALAQATGDPLVVKLVTFFQLLGGGDPDSIQAFISSSPDWPEQGTLALRLAEGNGTYVPSSGPAPVPFLAQVQTMHEQGNDSGAAALWISEGKAAGRAVAVLAGAGPVGPRLAHGGRCQGRLSGGDRGRPADRRCRRPRPDRRPRFPRRFPAPPLFEGAHRSRHLVY
jgi:hypothetical protein